MPKSAEFSNTLDLIAEYVQEIGDTIEDEYVEELFAIEIQDEDYWLTGHRCSTEDAVYVVAGHPQLRLMSVAYFFSLQNNVAYQLDKDTTDALLEESGIEVEAEEDDEQEFLEKIEAAKILLNRIDKEEMSAIENYIYMMISGGDHETQIYNTDSGVITGFNTANLIFPYERSFGIKEFYETVQSTIESGQRGNRLLGRTMIVRKDKEDLTESRIELNFGW